MTTPRSPALRLAIAGVFVALVNTAPSARAGVLDTTRAFQDPRDGSAARVHASSGAIAGTVTSLETARPIRHATVTLTSTDGHGSFTQTTDDSGRFLFANLSAGVFTLSATKPGLSTAIYGQKKSGSGRDGTPIRLAADQRLDRVALAVPRMAALSGIVTDDHGDVAWGASVRVMRYVMQTGERTLQVVGFVQTDDRGAYRAPGLLPGEYIVAVTPQADQGSDIVNAKRGLESAALSSSDADRMKVMAVAEAATTAAAANGAPAGFAPVYYPSTTSLSGASSVMVDVAEEHTGVDVVLQMVPLSRVSGVVTGADGQPVARAQILLSDERSRQVTAFPISTTSGADGTFVFNSVAPGQYTIRTARAGAVAEGRGSEVDAAMKASASGTADPDRTWAASDVTVDGRDVTGTTLSLRAGRTQVGRVLTKGSLAPDKRAGLRLTLTAVTRSGMASTFMTVAPALVDADGRFTFRGIAPGFYRVGVAATPPGWNLESAIVNGRDALDVLLEVKADEDAGELAVTFSDRATALTGVLQNASGQPATDFTIVAFASEERFWGPQSRRIRAARPATDGSFGFKDLPAGDYLLAAVTDVEPGQWFDPAFLRQSEPAAVPVRLVEGTVTNQNLRIR